MQVCAIKAPGFGENRKANLQDLAALTGGQVRNCFGMLLYKIFSISSYITHISSPCMIGHYRRTWNEH